MSEDKEFHYGVYIGRFQPYHKGHHNTALAALEKCAYLIFAIGSDQEPRTAKNPFTFEERVDIIKSAFTSEQLKQIRFFPQINYLYNDQRWIASIQSSVRTVIANDGWRAGPIKIALTGFDKDGSSYYLKFFPEWGWIPAPEANIHATDIRKTFYERRVSSGITFKIVEEEFDRNWFANSYHLREVITKFTKLISTNVIKEYHFLKDYKKQWENSPYAPTFVTGDAVVVQGGHILLVERGAMPGEGLLALPGGFIQQDETIEQGIIRELYEETGLKVPRPVIKGSIDKIKVFDNPFRSQRGRTITHAALIKLADRDSLPPIKGSDDARNAFWLELSLLRRDNMFEDHFDIIDDLLGGVPTVNADRPRVY